MSSPEEVDYWREYEVTIEKHGSFRTDNRPSVRVRANNRPSVRFRVRAKTRPSVRVLVRAKTRPSVRVRVTFLSSKKPVLFPILLY